MLETSVKLPMAEEIRKLSAADTVIAADLSNSLRDRLRKYIHIDPYCMPDPFGETDGYSYSLILDPECPNSVVAIFANKNESLPQLPWSAILGGSLVKTSIRMQEALALKRELMPKETNNFYPYRRNGRIAGYVMFAFQVCGQR